MVMADASDAGIAQLYSKIMPAACILAPIDKAMVAAMLPPEVTSQQRELLGRASLATITWLTHELELGSITGGVPTEQACLLLCALSDIVFAAYMVLPPTTTTTTTSSSSSSTHQRRRAAEFLRLSCAGESAVALQAPPDAEPESAAMCQQQGVVGRLNSTNGANAIPLHCIRL
jgi:hypothetical protein